MTTDTTPKKTTHATIRNLAQHVIKSDKKVQLIYAFNGSGKTRLATEICAALEEGRDSDSRGSNELIWFSAETEDSFYWHTQGVEPYLKIFANASASKLLTESGATREIINTFHKYLGNSAIHPYFHEDLKEVSFSVKTPEGTIAIKLSKGEETCFIWSVFYTYLKEHIDSLKDSPPKKNKPKHVFIDDPVSSLDDAHLFDIAFDLVQLIKQENPPNVKYVIATHNPLFFNILYNNFNKADSFTLKNNGAEGWDLIPTGESPFAYHLWLREQLATLGSEKEWQKVHFNQFRQLLEKTAHFLGYGSWKDLVENDHTLKAKLNILSHFNRGPEETSAVSSKDQEHLTAAFKAFIDKFNFRP